MIRPLAPLALVLLVAASSPAAGVKLVDRPPDPHGSPRPARDAKDVPLRTSLYFELAMAGGKGPTGGVDPEKVATRLRREGGDAVELLRPGRRFADGASGWLRPKGDLGGNTSLAVYIELPRPLEPATTYRVEVSAGGTEEAGSWSFTTEPAPRAYPLAFAVDLAAEPVSWHGRFFSGLCNVIFCSQAANYGPTYELMAAARKGHPRAWDYQRDFWPTGTEFRPAGLLPQRLPNIVRERETRRIAAIDIQKDKVILRVEDVFGHEQYGIPAGRSPADDYRPGDEVLIADGVHDARAKVLAADERTVTVTPFVTPAGGWKIAYEGPLPTKEDPDAPGLFPPGGCYLRKFAPHGTACYDWGRLDKEWDLAHKVHGRRLMVNFADATGDLARDGRSWTTAKDLAQWHDVARAIAGHVIDRYGKDALDFTWSIFNEPDLGPLFWRADWDELQRFYDYTADAILRAFEDRGYDSNKVVIGGLELGAIFGTNLRLREFLAHCSPRATAEGALPLNAAFADRRLDGKRSRRVEALCRAHGGKGSPCDFVSIHSYNRSEAMAAKLIRAKEIALEVDPEYYRALRVNSHESCPDWMPPPDQAAADAYLGNGYFPTWCADVVHRQLLQAAKDPRFAFGETILTVWPPPDNFAGLNAITRNLHVDENGDGRADRAVAVPMPVFHALTLLADLGDRFWVLPRKVEAGHAVGGFASRDDRGVIRLLLFAHHAQDTQSRSEATFDVTVDLDHPDREGPARMVEYRIDRDHNSPFHRIRSILDREANARANSDRLAAVQRGLDGDDPAAQRRALEAVATLDPPTRRAALEAVVRLAGRSQDPAIRNAATALLRDALDPASYPADVVDAVRRDCRLEATGTATVDPGPGGRLRLKVRLSGNGCNFVVLRPADGPAR